MKAEPLRVVLLTCDRVPVDMAAALTASPSINLVGIFVAPMRRPRSLAKRVRAALRYHGWAGMIVHTSSKVRGLLSHFGRNRTERVLPAYAPTLTVRDFHDAATVEQLKCLAPDICVVDGTYILRPEVFAVPPMGSLNLHCGRLPDYRGAPPVFWELFNGEREVGVTVHAVTTAVDEGPIYAQSIFPLPSGGSREPITYAKEVWLSVLRPEGIRLMVRTLEEIMAGTAQPQAQGRSRHPTYRMPDRAIVQALRRRMGKVGARDIARTSGL